MGWLVGWCGEWGEWWLDLPGLSGLLFWGSRGDPPDYYVGSCGFQGGSGCVVCSCREVGRGLLAVFLGSRGGPPCHHVVS